MGYKLFEHQKMLDDVLEVLDEYPLFSAVRKPDLEATLSQAQARVDRFLEKQDRVKLLRFRQILSELFNEGKEVFRYGEHAVRLANLTSALNQLADEAET